MEPSAKSAGDPHYKLRVKAEVGMCSLEGMALVCSVTVALLGCVATVVFNRTIGGVIIGVGIFGAIVSATILLQKREQKRYTVRIPDIYTRFIGDMRRRQLPTKAPSLTRTY